MKELVDFAAILSANKYGGISDEDNEASVFSKNELIVPPSSYLFSFLLFSFSSYVLSYPQLL